MAAVASIRQPMCIPPLGGDGQSGKTGSASGGDAAGDTFMHENLTGSRPTMTRWKAMMWATYWMEAAMVPSHLVLRKCGRRLLRFSWAAYGRSGKPAARAAGHRIATLRNLTGSRP